MPEGVVEVTGAMTALLAASSGSSSSSGSGGTTFIIFLVLIALVGYFLLIRPQKQKARRQREQQQQIGVGDEILTVGGIVGRVIAVDSDRVTILSGGDTVGFPAVGNEPTRLVLVRNAISRRMDPPIVPDPDAEHATGEPVGDGTGGYEPYSSYDGLGGHEGDDADDEIHYGLNGGAGTNGTNGTAAGGDEWSAEGAENEGKSS